MGDSPDFFAILYLFSSVLDEFDGYFARKLNQSKSTRHTNFTVFIRGIYSVNVSLGSKNEFYHLQRGFQSCVNSAWISHVSYEQLGHIVEQFLL